jgi:hypothetical protein
MRLVAVIPDETVARKILEHLGLPARAPPRGRRAGGRPRRLREQLPRPDFGGVDPPSLFE